MIPPIIVATVLAAALLLAWRRSGRTGVLAWALLWAAYAVYESLVHARVLCSGECNIRVDLLLIYPVLLAGALWSGIAALRARRSGRC